MTETQTRIIISYCKSIKEMLDAPSYTLTALKIKRIKRQIQHIADTANDPNI